ncbi:Alpha/beta hydrolase family protein [Gemmata sp. SH-PL17]|uniref:dienelactone hydrolase family protein n=1 Tax=Gemmata sp. SH-PL17 TaxID=1630693 RepID=UPI00078C3EBF|nr:dienelactone hydrolase family protein [Gemmata sp. SH-PL17]AMV23593.1 Alpha/beta hydrolase family protein [Gemmata sp. SH-PL17]
MKPAFHRVLFLIVSSSALSAAPLFAADPVALPNTKPLGDEGNLSEKMVAGMHKYLDRALAASVKSREALWKTDNSSPEAFAKSVDPNRERLRKYLGVVDKRSIPHLEYLGVPERFAVAETERYKVFAVRWAVLPGLDAEGLLLEPRGKIVAAVVAVPDADQTPEQIVGLSPGLPAISQFARRLAESECRVLVPVLIDRRDTLSANPKLGRTTNLPHREFVHRMAYEMGRTLIGYEVQKVLAAVDWLSAPKDRPPVWAAGYGEGGLVALCAGALDARIERLAVSGYFGAKPDVWNAPLDRNVWGLQHEFGDAELAALAAPRLVFIGNCETPKFDGPAKPQPGRGGAAPGTLGGCPIEQIETEWKRINDLTGGAGVNKCSMALAEKLVPAAGLDQLVLPLNLRNKATDGRVPPTDLRQDFSPVARHKRQFDQLVAYTQKLWRDSEAVRKEFWKKADARSPEAWEKSCDWYRDYFHTEVIGKLPDPKGPLNPRTRQVYDEKTWAGYEVVLDVYDDVFAYGILLLPKDLKPGEKRPVVVCQHGLEGTPRHTIDVEQRTVYNHFSRRLVELGYIVYAPQNPYYGENVFRQVQRKANPLKLSLFSFIIRQHQRTLDWLETLPNVDPKKIAFYGLSYGGKTAMRVPAVEKRYCLSICSGDFNEWIGKNVSVDLDRSYMWTREYEMYEFDLGNTFNYAEMAYLIAPRPFMVERGHDDGVGTDEMVAYEFAKVRYLYANRLKIPGNTTIEFFPGGHQINAKGTFAFLKAKLDYPK